MTHPTPHPTPHHPRREAAPGRRPRGLRGSRQLGRTGAVVGGLLGALLVAPATAGSASPVEGHRAPAAPATSSGAPRTTLSAGAQRALAATPSTGRVRVVVTLRDRADLSDLSGLARPSAHGRAVRLGEVVQRLRGRAATSQGSLRARLSALAAAGEVSSPTSLWVTDAVAVTATPRAVRELAARADVASVVPDAITLTPAAVPVEPNVTAVGAPGLWVAGQTGRGAVVAVLDSGVDLANPDLAARWRGGGNSWFDPYGQHATPADLSGHGTMTTGVVVGGQDAGTSYGVAPGASFVSARVFDDRGAASITAIHQAFQWVLDPDHDPTTADAPQVVNGSWVLGSGPGCDTTFQADLQALRAAGIVPVFAAGNFGTAAGTSASPANYPEAFSVGAVTASDAVWSASSNGPSTCGGRTRAFPDVVAPGSSVLVADRYDGYTYASGTSVAAPHVSGALALLAGAHPTAPGTALEDALRASAVDLGAAGPDDRFGWGRIDASAASALVVDPPPAPVPDASVALSPASASVRAGASAAFAVTLTPVDGYAAPTSLAVTGLPAGATAGFAPATLGPGGWSSTLTVTTLSTLATGTYPFTVTATGGGLTRTAGGTLTVTAPADFTVAASPSSRSVLRNQNATYTISVGATGGFTGSVALSRSLLPGGATSSFSRSTVTAPGSATLTLRPGTTTRRGTYAVTVTGTASGRTHSVVVTLTVR